MSTIYIYEKSRLSESSLLTDKRMDRLPITDLAGKLAQDQSVNQ